MKKIKRKILSLLLTLCMILSLLPAPVYAAVADLAGNSAAQNERILDQLQNFSGESYEEAYDLLSSFGLLDESGNLDTDQTIVLDGTEYTLTEIEALLTRADTDLSQTAEVDGVPIALGDLKTIVAIEGELARIREKYFSEKTFEGEALENLNGLMDQMQSGGISVSGTTQSGNSAAQTEKAVLDVSSFDALEFGPSYGIGRGLNSGLITGEGKIQVTYDPGLLGDSIEKIVVGQFANGPTDGVEPSTAVTLTKDNPTGTVSLVHLARMRIYVYRNLHNQDFTHYSYGDLSGSVTLSSPDEDVVFLRYGTYSNAHTVRLTTQREMPLLSASVDLGDSQQEYSGNPSHVYFPFGDSQKIAEMDALRKLLQDVRGEEVTEANAVYYKLTGNFSQTNNLSQGMPLGNANRPKYRTFYPKYINDTMEGAYTDWWNQVQNPTVFADWEVTLESGGALHQNGSAPFSLTGWSATAERAIPEQLYVMEVFDSLRGPSTVTTYTKGATLELLDDKADPQLLSITAPEGTYCPGQMIPVTLTFDELVKVADGTAINVNGKEYTAADLGLNTAGNQLVLWYRVQPVDNTNLTISFGDGTGSGVTDVWGNKVEINGEEIPGVSIVSTQRRNAVKSMDVTVADSGLGVKTATATITLVDNETYKQDIQDYARQNGNVLPFRVAIYVSGGEKLADLPIKMVNDETSGSTIFTSDPYELPSGVGEATWFHAVLQVNEQAYNSPQWEELPWWEKNFSGGVIYPVTRVRLDTDMYEGFTITEAEQTHPTLTATPYTGVGGKPTHATGEWVCVNTDQTITEPLANIVPDSSDPLTAKVTPNFRGESGWIECTYVADNGTPEDTSDDVVSNGIKFYVVGADKPFLGFAFDTVTTTRYAALTLNWSSNLKNGPTYTIKLYQGDLTDESVSLDEEKLVNTYTTAKTNFQIPAGVLSQMSQGVAYTVELSAPNGDTTLSDRLGIILKSQPVTAKLVRPDTLYYTDETETVEISWKLEGLPEGQNALFTIQRVQADNETELYVSQLLSAESGTYELHPYRVNDGGLKDTYQITLTVNNGDQAPSTDAFAIHVYNRDALQIVDEEGQKITSINMDNDSEVMNYGPGSSETQNEQDTETVLALRQQLGLLDYIGVNYGEYSWDSFRDGIRWASDNDAISINYKQGGLYENIKNFNYDTYLPELLMGISATEDGTATITATHALTDMTDSITVDATTLKDKFYLFQVVNPAKTVTTLRYKDANGYEKTVKTNSDGVLALYEPQGIHSDVQMSAEATVGDQQTEYLGTIRQEDLLSGEGDATKLQLYPLNVCRLREAAKVELTLVTPDGSPLADSKVTIRGGVYRNGRFCNKAGLGISRDAAFDNAGTAQQETGTKFETDADGKVIIYFNPDQFTNSADDVLVPSDQIEYVLEIRDIAGDKYYPLFHTVSGSVSPQKEMRTAASVVVLEEVLSDEKNKPFIAQQTVTSIDASGREGLPLDVRRSTGFVGPNSSFPSAKLHTTVLAWGQSLDNNNMYRLQIADENGHVLTDTQNSNVQYPFASIPVEECSITLSAQNMTDAGWVKSGEDVGLKIRLEQLEGEEDNENWALNREITLPFRVIDLTKVPHVDKDERVTGMLVSMSKASLLEEATNAFTHMSGDDVVGKLAGGLLNLTGGIDSSVFKMLITPSEDPTVFNALIWAGYDDLELGDADYSEEGVAMGLYSGEFETGLPTSEKVSSMARGSYIPTSVSRRHPVGFETTGADLKLNLEGFYEAEIRYDLQDGQWKVYTKGGGFAAGAGVELGFDVNTVAGIVPVTGSFRMGGSVQLSFETALRYNQGDEPVNDFLTNLRLKAYVKAFGGFGFDYTLVALKIGLFGELSLDSQNKFLNTANGEKLQGQQLTLGSQVGIKFVAECLCISYEAVLASISYSESWPYNQWKDIEDYWDGTGTGLSLKSLQAAAAPSGLAVTSATATLQSRDYLEQYARSWGQPQARFALFAPNGSDELKELQTNANPTSFPEISDDGQILAYISDGYDPNTNPNPSIYESRVHVSELEGSNYGISEKIADPPDFSGNGDSDVDLAGTGTFAAAAWVRLKDKIEGKDSGANITTDEQNTLMNGAEIVVSTYNGTNWTSQRLTDNSAPDLAPAVAVSGNQAIVFWRSVISNVESTEEGGDDLLAFSARDCLMYSIYNGTNWSEPAMLYNGSNGAVKGLQAAMLPDGTAIAVYTLDRSTVDSFGEDESGYEVGYTIVECFDKLGTSKLGTSMLVTSDTWLDENPQVVTANFGSNDQRFVIGWHSLRDGESDIRMLAVNNEGAMTNDFPASLTALIQDGSAAVNGSFRFAAMDTSHSISDLTVIWNETVTDKTTESGLAVAAHSELKAAKLVDGGEDSYHLSSPQEVAKLHDNNLVNHFSPYLSGSDQVKAVIQTTQYSNAEGDQQTSEGITVPGEQAKLYTASSTFQKYAVEVESIGVDYETLAKNSNTPIQFTIRNTGLESISGLTVTVDKTAATQKEALQPGASTTLTVLHQVGNTVSNPSYTITGDSDTGISETGTVYLDYPDIGISQMKVLKEEKGQRTIAVTLYNAADAALAESGREVKLAFYTDNLMQNKAPITCSTNGFTVGEDKTITISDKENLARIDNGTFTLVLTYDVGSYVNNTLKKEEIPDSGVYLYADAWAEGKVGEQEETQRLPEYCDSDNQSAALLTGAYARSGYQYISIDVERQADTSGTTAKVTLTNNSLQQYDNGNLLAILMDENGNPLDQKVVSMTSGAPLDGETSVIQNVTFEGKEGYQILVYPFSVDDLLRFDGLNISTEDFTDDGNNNFSLTYQIKESDGATQRLLITACSNKGGSLDKIPFSSVGTMTVDLNTLRGEDAQPRKIEMRVGSRNYTLTLEPQGYSTILAQFPTITVQPQDAAYKSGEKANSLEVKAQVNDGGTLSYQWYQTTDRATEGPFVQTIPGATNPFFTPPIDTTGQFSYFCRVTNTLPTGESNFTTSNVAIITVNESETKEYRITFNAAGGVCSVDTAWTTDGKLLQLPTATRPEYTFDGWFTEENGGYKVAGNTVFSKDTELYAHWTKAGQNPGGGTTTYYAITVKPSSHGEVKADRTEAAAGSTVTLTVKPESGYHLNALTVTDADGKNIKLTNKGSGVYTFTMPSGAVTVQATFAIGSSGGFPFIDVPENSWYYDGVVYVYENGLMEGTSATTFSPNIATSRAMIATILWRLEGSPVVSYDMNFSDVEPDRWYTEAVRWANSVGVVVGYGNGKFGTNDSITREQMAAMLYRYAKYKGYDVSMGDSTDLHTYTDFDQLSQWAVPAMQWACGADIITGTSASTLSPRGSATRAQAAVMFMRFHEKYAAQ
jgi:uncharacterized repeat protein (TIGR02543 family)